MLYDGFLYAGEDECVAIRRAELTRLRSPVVHVAVQGDRTFQGNVRGMIRPPRGVESVKVTLPLDCDSWERERYQRDAISRTAPLSPPDLPIIVSDADEIPNAQAVTYGLEILHEHPEAIVVLKDRTFYLTLETRVADWEQRDVYPVLLYAGQLRELGANRARYARAFEATTLERYEVDEPRGWHFSYLGGPDRVVEKIRSFAHTEFADIPDDTIRTWVLEGKVPYSGDDTLVRCPISYETHPECIVHDPDRWRNRLDDIPDHAHH